MSDRQTDKQTDINRQRMHWDRGMETEREKVDAQVDG